MHHGYWILLTSLFVCQPNYNATRHRLKLRIIGTLVGIAIGIPVLWFVPSLEGQLVLLVITGVLFFAFRNVQYAHATMFITLLVLLCFNLLGEGFEVALPRVIDTLIGCAIAWAANVVAFPKVFSQSQQFLAVDMIVKVKGRVDADEKGVQIIADRIMPLKVNYSQAKHVAIHIYSQYDTPENSEALKRLLTNTAGSVPTSLYLHRQRKRINLPPNMCFDPSDESIKAIEAILGDGSVEVQ